MKITRTVLLGTLIVCACGSDNSSGPSPQLQNTTVSEAENYGEDQALEAVNDYRRQMNLSEVALSDTLNLAARNHSHYYLHNVNSDCVPPGLGAHFEKAGCPQFTGERPWDRTTAAGFNEGQGIAECMHFIDDPQRAVFEWMESVYHRPCIADPLVSQMGFASLATADDSEGVDTLDVALSDNVADTVIARWPMPNTGTDILSFDGREVPQPPAPSSGFPVGRIISVMVPNARVLRFENARLFYNDIEVPSQFLSSQNDQHVSSGHYFLYSHKPLIPARTYRVEFSGTKSGAPYVDSWSFQTLCQGGGATGWTDCQDNKLVGCNALGQPTERSCEAFTCVSLLDSSMCTVGAQRCDVPDGTTLRCDGQTLIGCLHGYEVVAKQCSSTQECRATTDGFYCVESPVQLCADYPELLAGCDGDKIVTCEHDYLRHTSCAPGQTCVARGSAGGSCVDAPVIACGETVHPSIGCLGNARLDCVDHYAAQTDCGQLYCTVNTDGSGGFCAVSEPSCNRARCAGQVPVACEGGIEVAHEPCASPAICTVEGLQASCVE